MCNPRHAQGWRRYKFGLASTVDGRPLRILRRNVNASLCRFFTPRPNSTAAVTQACPPHLTSMSRLPPAAWFSRSDEIPFAVFCDSHPTTGWHGRSLCVCACPPPPPRRPPRANPSAKRGSASSTARSALFATVKRAGKFKDKVMAAAAEGAAKVSHQAKGAAKVRAVEAIKQNKRKEEKKRSAAILLYPPFLHSLASHNPPAECWDGVVTVADCCWVPHDSCLPALPGAARQDQRPRRRGALQ